jgi:hypothetical protein
MLNSLLQGISEGIFRPSMPISSISAQNQPISPKAQGSEQGITGISLYSLPYKGVAAHFSGVRVA